MPSNSITAYENWPPSNISISFTQPLRVGKKSGEGWMVTLEALKGEDLDIKQQQQQRCVG